MTYVQEEHESAIRAAINCAHPITGDDHDAVDQAHPALDSLLAYIKQLEQGIVGEAFGKPVYNLGMLQARAEAAEALVKQLEGERDEWAREFKRVQDIGFANSEETASLINAEFEAENERLREALEQISRMSVFNPPGSEGAVAHAPYIARGALAVRTEERPLQADSGSAPGSETPTPQ